MPSTPDTRAEPSPQTAAEPGAEASPATAPKTAAPAASQPVPAKSAKAPAKVAARPGPASKGKPVKAAVEPAKPAGLAKPKAAARPIKAAKPVKPAKPAAKPAHKREKLVRDSFTIPKGEYAVLDALKQRAIGLAHPVKKGELLRAGIKALAALDDAALLAAMRGVPAIKTGRPAG